MLKLSCFYVLVLNRNDLANKEESKGKERRHEAYYPLLFSNLRRSHPGRDWHVNVETKTAMKLEIRKP